MRLYHFLNEEYGLLAIQNKRLKVGRVKSFNDPFEFLHFNTENHFTHRVLSYRKKRVNIHHGVICFSKNFTNPVQWAHYADSHNGLCLGFDVPDKYLLEVEYIEDRSCINSFKDALDISLREFTRSTLSKKFKHWEYEEEMRLIIDFDKPQSGDDLIFKDFYEDLKLKEIIIGCKNSIGIKGIKKTIGKNNATLELKKVIPSPTTFQMILA